MPYLLSNKFDFTGRVSTRRVLREGIRAGQTSTAIIDSLKTEGLSYRRTNMLRDIRRAQRVEVSRRGQPRQNAVKWFDEVFESFQKENNLTPQQATTLWDRSRTETFDTTEEAELQLQWQELYNNLFPSGNA